MPRRVSPIETIRADIDTVFGSGKPIEECLEELMRHSVRGLCFSRSSRTKSRPGWAASGTPEVA